MVTLDDLTNFSGIEGEDALKWYKSFIGATSVLGERGMLSNFPLYLEPDSPAQVWCDELPDDVLSSWTAVDRNFRRTWLRQGGGKPEDREKFQNHHLTDDAIFAPTCIDAASMNKVVVDWAENHLQLGVASKLSDAALIQTTLQYLPAFIRAFLKYKMDPPKTFQQLCTRIKEIEDHILEFEQLRRQEKSVDWQAKMEKKQDDMTKIVKKTQSAIEKPQDSTVEDTSAFFVPEEWKKTQVTINKGGMVEIVKELIRTLRKYKPNEINIDTARMVDIGLLHYYDAIKAPGQFHSSTITGQAGTKTNVLLGVFQINYDQAFNGLDDVTEATETWDSISNSSHVLQGECIYKPYHTHRQYTGQGPVATSLNNIPYYGGLAKIGNHSAFPYIGISSFTTALCLLMSAHLAERIPNDSKGYKQAGIESAEWIKKWAYDEGNHLANIFHWDMYHGQGWGTTALSPHVTGLFIEGLCVLAAATGEQKWRSLANNTCDAAMVYRDWHDDDGVFKYVSPSGVAAVDDANLYRGLLIRGLSVAYQRNPNNKRLRHTIRSYINVQFNALRDGAHYRGSYAVLWNGQYGTPYVHGQVAALDVLMAAVIVNHC